MRRTIAYHESESGERWYHQIQSTGFRSWVGWCKGINSEDQWSSRQVSGQTFCWCWWFNLYHMSRWLVPDTLFVVFAECGLITGVARLGCSFLDRYQRSYFKGNVGHVCLRVHSPVFLKAVADGDINNLDEYCVKSRFVIDICNLSRFFVKIIGVLRCSHVCRFCVARDFGIYFSYRLTVWKLL